LQDLPQQVVLGSDGGAAERVEVPERPWGLHPQHQPSYSRHRSPLSPGLGHGRLVDDVSLQGRQVDPYPEPAPRGRSGRATPEAELDERCHRVLTEEMLAEAAFGVAY